jgi:hypothetical protein
VNGVFLLVHHNVFAGCKDVVLVFFIIDVIYVHDFILLVLFIVNVDDLSNLIDVHGLRLSSTWPCA